MRGPTTAHYDFKDERLHTPMIEVRCSHCKKVYGLPEQKLPVGEKTSFRCPACKGIITIDRANQEEVFEIADEVCEEQPAPLFGPALKEKILRSAGDLPVMPQIIPRIQEVMANPNAGLDDLVKVIESDQGAAAMVLKLTNSAYYGLRGDVSSIKQAAVLVGFETLGKYVLMAGTSSMLGKGLKGYTFMSGSLWKHSLRVAFASKLIASRQYAQVANDAFLAGLIHDIGKIILDQHVFKNKKLFAQLRSNHGQSFTAEQQFLGFDHAEIGYDACVNWHFPAALINPIRYHHDPHAAGGSIAARIVYVADAVAQLTGAAIQEQTAAHFLDPTIMESLDLQEQNIPALLSETDQAVNALLAQLENR